MQKSCVERRALSGCANPGRPVCRPGTGCQPRGPGYKSARLAGALLVTAGLMLFVYAIAGTTRYGCDSARTFPPAALALALLEAFLTRQATARTATAAAHLLGARHHRCKPRPAPGDRRRVGVPDHHHLVHAARPRLRRGHIRPGPAPHSRGHRHRLARLVRPHGRPLRTARCCCGTGAHSRPAVSADLNPRARGLSGAHLLPPLLIFCAGGGLASGLFNTTSRSARHQAWRRTFTRFRAGSRFAVLGGLLRPPAR